MDINKVLDALAGALGFLKTSQESLMVIRSLGSPLLDRPGGIKCPRPLMEQLQIVIGVKNPLVVGKCTPVTSDLPAVMKNRDLVYTQALPGL